MPAILGWILFLSMPLVVLLTTLAFAAPAWRRARASASWPTAQGHVSSSQRFGTGRVAVPDIRYVYTVDGVDYAGRTVRFNFSWAYRSTMKALAAFPVGRSVCVHYDPMDPATSVLETGIDKSDVWRALLPPIYVAIVMLGVGVVRLIHGRW
jgi:hypothetical protein